MLKRIFNILKANSNDTQILDTPVPPLSANDIIENPDDAHRSYLEFQKESADDLIFFPKINAYGVFKYDVAKDVLLNNRAIGVSEVHRTLSTLYFSIDEKKHENNKSSAFKYLDFFAQELQNEPDEFINNLFSFLVSKFPINQQFNLVEYLINPLIIINKLNEYGFLEYMPEYDFRKNTYNHESALKIIKSIFEGEYSYDEFIEKYMEEVGIIPAKLQKLIDNMQSDHKITGKLLKNFLSSLMFAGSHSTASFLSSWVTTLFMQYPDLLESKDTSVETLHSIADEVLRIYTPVSYIYRTVRQDVSYRGKDLKEGDTVIVFVGAANLDANVFEYPGKIDLCRNRKHLAFGMGAYVCLGRFSVYRLAKNVFSNLTNYSKQIQFVDEENRHEINGAILKQSMIRVKFNH